MMCQSRAKDTPKTFGKPNEGSQGPAETDSYRFSSLQCSLSDALNLIEDESEPGFRRAPSLRSLSSMSSMTTCSYISEAGDMEEYMASHWPRSRMVSYVPTSVTSHCCSPSISTSSFMGMKCVGRKRCLFPKYWEKAGTPMAFRPAVVPENCEMDHVEPSLQKTSPSLTSRRSIFISSESTTCDSEESSQLKSLLSHKRNDDISFLSSRTPAQLARSRRHATSLASLPIKSSPQLKGTSPSFRRSCLRQGRFSPNESSFSLDTDDMSTSDETNSSQVTAVTFSPEVEVTVFERPLEIHAPGGWTSYFSP